MKLVAYAVFCICVASAVAQSRNAAPAPPASPASVQQTVPIMLPGSSTQQAAPSAPPIGSERVGLPATPERIRQVDNIEREQLAKRKSHNLPRPEAFWKDYKRDAEVQPAPRQ